MKTPAPGKYASKNDEYINLLFCALDKNKNDVCAVYENAQGSKFVISLEDFYKNFEPFDELKEKFRNTPPVRYEYTDELAVECLKANFGYDDFREGQEVVIRSIMYGRDTLGIMPTGAGKSICYQIPALMLKGTALVISPLISLMKDQVAYLKQNGIKAAYLNSSLSMRQFDRALENARSGEYKIIYIAPERLSSESFISLCRSIDISLIAVDEAHCISQWGQDFRPSYLEIPQFFARLDQRPRLCAFTATATTRVRDDIISMLKMNNPYVCVTSFDRPNLCFKVKHVTSKKNSIVNLVKSYGDVAGIVYCATRRDVETVCDMLIDNDVPATRYHAGLSDEERARNQEDFSLDRCRVMVATNAFGMGIDKSDVRFVIHYSMPGDLESYYQEAGRAGRDGSDADCVLLYSKRDIFTQRFFIDKIGEEGNLSEDEIKEVKNKARKRLEQMIDYCESQKCLRSSILNYFGEDGPARCGNCSYCLGESTENETSNKKRAVKQRATGERDEELYLYLRMIRKEIAERRGIPAFVIFSDSTLADMSMKKPITLKDFSLVSGVGVVKEREYGKMFVEAIRRYLGKPV